MQRKNNQPSGVIQFVGVEPLTLKELILDGFKEDLEKVIKHLSPKPETYLNANQICEQFSIDKSTIRNWIKAGILTAYKLGGKTFFKLSDIEKQMQPKNSL